MEPFFSFEKNFSESDRVAVCQPTYDTDIILQCRYPLLLRDMHLEQVMFVTETCGKSPLESNQNSFMQAILRISLSNMQLDSQILHSRLVAIRSKFASGIDRSILKWIHCS